MSVKLKCLTAEKSRLEAFSPDKSKIEVQKSEYTKMLEKLAQVSKTNEEKQRQKDNRIKSLSVQLIISVLLTLTLIFIFLPIAVVSAAYGTFCLIMLIKSKNTPVVFEATPKPENLLDEIQRLEKQSEDAVRENTKSLVDVAQQIGDVQNQIKNIEIMPVSQIDADIKLIREKYNEYSVNSDELALTKECLQEAFAELQSSFGKKLNEETSVILSEITDNRYTGVLVDNEYNMLVRSSASNELRDAQYLSSGTYDQIYFALRMGIVKMLFDGLPVILDEAFIQYDDDRLKKVLE